MENLQIWRYVSCFLQDSDALWAGVMFFLRRTSTLTVKFFIYSQRAQPEAQDALQVHVQGEIVQCCSVDLLSEENQNLILQNPPKSPKTLHNPPT